MGSTGLDQNTFRVLRDFDHVVQSVGVIFNTPYASRAMRRWFFSGLPALLGRRITPRRVGLYMQLVQLAIDTWEPRLQVARVNLLTTSPELVRMGELEFEILVYYRPNGHKGDFRIEGGLRTLRLSAANDNEIVIRLPEPVAA